MPLIAAVTLRQAEGRLAGGCEGRRGCCLRGVGTNAFGPPAAAHAGVGENGSFRGRAHRATRPGGLGAAPGTGAGGCPAAPTRERGPKAAWLGGSPQDGTGILKCVRISTGLAFALLMDSFMRSGFNAGDVLGKEGETPGLGEHWSGLSPACGVVLGRGHIRACFLIGKMGIPAFCGHLPRR